MAGPTVKVLQCFPGRGEKGPIRVANIMLGTSLEIWNVKLWEKDGQQSVEFPRIEQTQWEKDNGKKPLRALRFRMEGEGDAKAFTPAALEMEKAVIDAIMAAEPTPPKPKPAA
jgi:hypothetical protein